MNGLAKGDGILPAQRAAGGYSPKLKVTLALPARGRASPACGAQGSFLSTISSEANHAARSAMSASVSGFATTPITSCARLPLR